jgi:hypothetical protein
MELLGGVILRCGVSEQSISWTNLFRSSAFIDVCCFTRLFEDLLIWNMEADSSECNIKVVCRFRPQSQSEVNSGGLLMTKYPAKSNDTTVFGVRRRNSIKLWFSISIWWNFLLLFFYRIVYILSIMCSDQQLHKKRFICSQQSRLSKVGQFLNYTHCMTDVQSYI